MLLSTDLLAFGVALLEPLDGGSAGRGVNGRASGRMNPTCHNKHNIRYNKNSWTFLITNTNDQPKIGPHLNIQYSILSIG